MMSYEQIYGNLVRQRKAAELLHTLLEEEFTLLRENKTEEVVALEFSIHELLRQIAAERLSIKEVMQNTRVAEYADMLGPEQSAETKAWLKAMEGAEPASSRQAIHNTRLSRALLDQGQELLDYLQEQVKPKDEVVYGSKGVFRSHRPNAAIFSGRL
mgnify:CR=1 FL=1